MTKPVWSKVAVVEPSDDSVVTISSTVNSVSDTIDFTVKVLLLFVVPDTVTRSRTASLPLPVSVVEVDDIVVNSFVQKFNTKYDQQLLDEQKTVLNLYIKSFVDNSVEFKMYLNEEIKRLKDEVSKAKQSNLINSDPDMLSKTEKIIEKLDSFKNTHIDEHVLSTVLKVQSLVKETVENGNSN